MRELPYLTGVSKEALSMAAGILTRRSWAVVAPDPAVSRAKLDPPAWAGRAVRGKMER